MFHRDNKHNIYVKIYLKYRFTVTISTMERLQSFFCWFTRFLFVIESPGDLIKLCLQRNYLKKLVWTNQSIR